MRLLILSFYYPPDLSAGSFRCRALVEALAPARLEGLEIDLLTTMPNRYHGMSETALAEEQDGGCRVRRIALPTHRSGMADQSRAFAVYARTVLRHVAAETYDAIFATSSRLMTAALAAHVARRKRVPLYLDIRDLFTDTIGDLFAGSTMKASLPFVRMLERRSFQTAGRISIVSDGFADHIRAIAPDVSIRSFTNGIDDEFLDADFSKPSQEADALPLILYAGNIGEGQGLHHIAPEAAALLAGRARFRIVGDGGRAGQLAEALVAAKVDVELLPPVPRARLHEHYREADILFLHLNAYPAFQKVLPSKIFEYGATGKPILAGVAGFAARFLADALPQGAAVFAPLDAQGLVRAFDSLARARGHPVDRTAFREQYARRAIMARMANDVTTFLADSVHQQT
jgi:glycosyltransferase involved in cell wall biosynthesis